MADPDDIEALLREIEAATGGSPKAAPSQSGQVQPVPSKDVQSQGESGGSAFNGALVGGGIAAGAVALITAPLAWLPGIDIFPAALGAFLGAAGMSYVKDRKRR